MRSLGNVGLVEPGPERRGSVTGMAGAAPSPATLTHRSAVRQPMEKTEFERLFDARVAQPLASLGFQPVGRSLHARISDAEIALIRLGGRMSTPGQIAHVLCVRKTWLRTRDEVVPDGFVREPFDHPYKLRPSVIERGSILRSPFRYAPQNLNYDYDQLEFASGGATEVGDELDQLRLLVAEQVVPWASTLTARSLLKALRGRGQNAWIERLWMEDCIARAST